MWINMHWKHARTYGINTNFYWMYVLNVFDVMLSWELWQATWRKKYMYACCNDWQKNFQAFILKLRNKIRIRIACSVLYREHHNSMCTSNNTEKNIKYDLRTQRVRQMEHLLRFRLLYFYLWIYGSVHLPLLQHLTGTCPFIPYFFLFLLRCFVCYTFRTCT